LSINIPNLPSVITNRVLLDTRVAIKCSQTLKLYEIEIIPVPKHDFLTAPVASHPDILLHHLGNEEIIISPNLHPELRNKLSSIGYTLVEGMSVLSSKYPNNIAYNVARVGGKAFHNLKYTDPTLMYYLKRNNIKCIHVPQGYSKCSICIINKDAIITSDKKIAEVARENQIDVLLLPPQKDILLHGLDYGFIGGATGLISSNLLAISGNISHLSSFVEIQSFANKHGVKVLNLFDEPVVDCGSIIAI